MAAGGKVSARDQILGSIRRSLGREGPLPDDNQRALDHRLTHPEAHTRPACEDDRVQRFRLQLEAAGGSVQRVPDIEEVTTAVTEYLQRQQLPARLVAGSDTPLDRIEWPATLTVEHRAAQGDDRVSVTTALLGVAETASLLMVSQPSSPTTLNFLPDHHIVVLDAARLVPHLEDAWRVLRERWPVLPRTVNLISGPSKTGDVEQTIQLGAHGPRRLHVILYGANQVRGVGSGSRQSGPFEATEGEGG